MTARVNDAFKSVNTRIIKDPAVAEIQIKIDTSQWSNRKKNLIIGALKTDTITKLGYETAELVDELLYHFQLGANYNVCRNSHCLPTKMIDPDKWEECKAYLMAMFRISSTGKRFSWYSQHFLREVELGRMPDFIPTPFEGEALYEFVDKYVKPVDTTAKEAREGLAQAIQNGETLTVTATPRAA